MTHTDLKQRHQIEREFHDKKATELDTEPHFKFYNLGALDKADQYSKKILKKIAGKKVLDYGCGTGNMSIPFAQKGGRVVAMDISHEYLKVAKKLAIQNSVERKIHFCIMAGEELPVNPDTFDFIYGHSILHHLDLQKAIPEISRVLKKSGRAVFLEPLDTNPLIWLFRKLTPSKRTPTEKPFTFKTIKYLEKFFSNVDHREFYCFSLLAYFWSFVIRNDKLFRFTLNLLSPIDDFLLKYVSFLKYFCWITVLELRK